MSTTAPRTAADSIAENTGSSPGLGASANSGKGFQEFNIESTDIDVKPGVQLNERQKVIVGSVLDLFIGRPSLPKLSLWTSTATFSDPITNAEGHSQYAAQWYGLQAAFSSIERLNHQVIDAGNPMVLQLSTKYTVKGIGKEQKIDSRVSIWTTGSEGDMKITKVEDAWDGDAPREGVFAKALRNLNSVVVPAFVSVPKNNKEDAEKGNQ